MSQKKFVPMTAGPESLEDYFQKGAFLGQKAALNSHNSIVFFRSEY